MKVTVRLLGTLRRYLPRAGEFNDLELDFTTPATVADVRIRVGIPAEESLMLLVNDERIAPDQQARRMLQPGDRIVISPAIRGG